MFFRLWKFPFHKEDKELKKVRKVRQRFEQEWLKVEGISSIGIGKEGNIYCIIICYSGNETFIRTIIPSQIEGIPIQFMYSGEFIVQ